MTVRIHISDGPLPAHPEPRNESIDCGAAGALVCFEGIVRELEQGHRVVALDYEVYEPMATRELQRLAEELARSAGLLALSVEHSRGRVPVGKCAFRLRVASQHRAAALHAVAAFIDRLKQDVPIWKHPVYAEGSEPA